MNKFPDITQAQVVAAVTWIISQAIAWGWVDNTNGQKLIAATASIVAAAWILADAYLRSGRNARAGAAIAAGRHPETGAPLERTDTAAKTSGR